MDTRKIVLLLTTLLIFASCWNDLKTRLADSITERGTSAIAPKYCKNVQATEARLHYLTYKYLRIHESEIKLLVMSNQKGIAGMICKPLAKWVIGKFEDLLIVDEMGCNTDEYKDKKKELLEKIAKACDDALDSLK